MSLQSSSRQCPLVCPWKCSEMCVLSFLTPETISEHHISLGTLQGLKALYPPDGFPPCVSFRGDIDWTAEHDDHATLTEHQHDHALVPA